MNLLEPLPSIDEITIPVLTETEWQGNSLLRWLIALGVLLGVAILARVIKGLITRRLQRVAAHTSTTADDAWLRVLERTAWYAYFALGLAVARPIVDLSKGIDKILTGATFILLGIQIAIWCETILSVALQRWAIRHHDSRTGTAAEASRFLGRLVIWSVLTLVVLSNLGIEITTIVAGLGVGGVAAALAVQSILSDLFAGLSMYFDRPFDLGDFIIVGDVLGVVRKIGLRTTRIDSLGGEKIIYPNGELTKNFIRNYARMEERRVTFTFRIEYNVETHVLDQARDIARQAVEHQSEVRFDRAHLKEFGDYSLDYEVVYYVLSADYNVYMDKQHAINSEIYRRFAEEGIPFAVPVRTIYTREQSGASNDKHKEFSARYFSKTART